MTVERRTDARMFPPPGYAHAAIATGATVYTAGAVPLDAEGTLIRPGDVAAQTQQVIDNLLSALDLAGAHPEDVVKTRSTSSRPTPRRSASHGGSFAHHRWPALRARSWVSRHSATPVS